MRGAIRHPVVHFLLLGVMLFGAERSLVSRAGDTARIQNRPLIRISALQVEELRREWIRRMGRPPSREESGWQIQTVADREILFREALALGLGQQDPVVRRRLIRNMRFLTQPTQRDDDELLREALELGMERSDVVVRRRLIQKIRFLASESAREREPTSAELEQALARQLEPPGAPERVRLSHVYLSRDRRGEALEADATRLAAELVARAIPPERAPAHGDPFLLPHHLPLYSEAQLARSFGPRFAREVMDFEPGAWSTPVASSYGLHLVWIHERTPRRPRPPASLRAEAVRRLRAEREQEALRSLLRVLRTRYDIRVED